MSALATFRLSHGESQHIRNPRPLPTYCREFFAGSRMRLIRPFSAWLGRLFTGPINQPKGHNADRAAACTDCDYSPLVLAEDFWPEMSFSEKLKASRSLGLELPRSKVSTLKAPPT